MKKFLNIIVPFLIMIIVIVVCVIIYMVFTGELPKFNSRSSLNNDEIVSSDGVILAKNELPKLDAVGISQSLMTAVIKDFTQDNNISEKELNYSSSEEGFNKLLNGDIDVLFSTYPTEEMISIAETQGINLSITPIAKDGLVFFVNSANPVDSLKVSDIQKIYMGDVKKWSEVGGDDLNIKAFQYPDNSSTQEEMTTNVMKKLKIIDAPKDVFYNKKFGDINDLIGLYDNTKEALGYTYYYEAKLLYDIDDEKEDAVKILKINNVEPNYDTIKSEKYPIIVNYYMIKNENNDAENVNIFTNAVLSDRGKSAIKGAGYVENE